MTKEQLIKIAEAGFTEDVKQFIHLTLFIKYTIYW